MLESGAYSRGDMTVWIVDTTSGEVIQPVNHQIETGVIGLVTKHLAVFQTHNANLSYRLCFHIASASASAYSIRFADIRVWEQEKNYGAIITDWQSYTPTFTGYPGLVTSNLQWRRVGSNLEIRGDWVGSAGSMSVSVPLTFTLPPGLSAVSNTNDYVIARFVRNTSGVNARKDLGGIIDTVNLNRVLLNIVEFSVAFSPYSDSTVANELTNSDERIGITYLSVPIGAGDSFRWAV